MTTLAAGRSSKAMRSPLAVLVAVLLVAWLTPLEAVAAPARALPATVRVNVTEHGVNYTLVASTGTITATTADGRLLYRGLQRLVVRTDVRRVEGVPISLPPPPETLTPDERRARRDLLREARVAELESRGAARIVTTPFEVSVLRTYEDAMGQPLLSAERPVVVRFTTDDGVLTVNGRGFRGVLETTTDDDGYAIIVNTVDTTLYLASVVGTEIPTTWEAEAMAAQAIAARTYLATRLGRHANYDLEGDVRDQAYDGIGKEVRTSLRAVERTAGILATYRGAPISALYSANAGGVTEDSENVFVNALPYLRSVPSPGDELAKNSSWGQRSWEWDREFTAPMLAEFMRVRGLDVGIPTKIEVIRKSASGRPLLTRVTGTRGTRDISKDSARYYFGLKSNMFTPVLLPPQREWVSPRDVDRLRDMEILGATRIATNHEFTFDDAGRRKGKVAVEFLYALPPRFDFIGKGFGHSVGMSQWGAQGMALGGATYEQILKHYYTGIALTNVGGP